MSTVVENFMHDTNARMALIARHPFLPGAIGYINADLAQTPVGRQVIEDWLEQGLTVTKVTLAEAMAQLNLHTQARQDSTEPAPPIHTVFVGYGKEAIDEWKKLPIMLRRQAD